MTEFVRLASFFALFLFSSLGIASAKSENQPFVSGSWRYKTTVVVETPEGIKTGSAVRRVWNDTSGRWLPLTQVVNPAEWEGEAVVVDLGSRGRFYALMRGHSGNENYASQVVSSAFGIKGASTAEGIQRLSHLRNAHAVLELKDYPAFVFFKDPNDAKTIESLMDIDRKRSEFFIASDRFEEFFGAGVRIKEISIEMTDEPVDWKIERVLPEFDKSFYAWKRTIAVSDPRKVSKQHFIMKKASHDR